MTCHEPVSASTIIGIPLLDELELELDELELDELELDELELDELELEELELDELELEELDDEPGCTGSGVRSPPQAARMRLAESRLSPRYCIFIFRGP